MKYGKIENNIVVQIQPNPEDGFIEIEDSVCCGMIKQGNTFINPIFKKTPEEIENERKQNIYSQISILESKTYRPLREQLVGTEEEKLKASTILGELDEQIKALRSQL